MFSRQIVWVYFLLPNFLKNLILVGNLEFTTTVNLFKKYFNEERMSSGEETNFLTCSNCSCLAFRCYSPVAFGRVTGGTVQGYILEKIQTSPAVLLAGTFPDTVAKVPGT